MLKLTFSLPLPSSMLKLPNNWFGYGKVGNKHVQLVFATLLQNELKSDAAHFTTVLLSTFCNKFS